MEPSLRPDDCPEEYDPRSAQCKACMQRESCREDSLNDLALKSMMEDEERTKKYESRSDNEYQNEFDSPPWPKIEDICDTRVMDFFASHISKFTESLKVVGMPVHETEFVLALFEMYQRHFLIIWKVWNKTRNKDDERSEQ